jgi:hypothetical protein
MPPEPQSTAVPLGGQPASWEDIVRYYAKQERVPEALAFAVARKESTDPKTGQPNPNAIGDGGNALGMFQLHAGAAQDTGVDRTDPVANIQGGIRYLRQLGDRYNGDVQKVLHAYNGGMDNVDKGTVSPAAQAYAASVIAELSGGLRTAQTNQPTTKTRTTAPPLPAAATRGMIPPSTIAKGDPPMLRAGTPEPSLLRRAVDTVNPFIPEGRQNLAMGAGALAATALLPEVAIGGAADRRGTTRRTSPRARRRRGARWCRRNRPGTNRRHRLPRRSERRC